MSLIDRFLTVKHDYDKLCDLFEESQIDERDELNSIFLNHFNVDLVAFYCIHTRCGVSLYYDFDYNIPTLADPDDYDLYVPSGATAIEELTQPFENMQIDALNPEPERTHDEAPEQTFGAGDICEQILCVESQLVATGHVPPYGEDTDQIIESNSMRNKTGSPSEQLRLPPSGVHELTSPSKRQRCEPLAIEEAISGWEERPDRNLHLSKDSENLENERTSRSVYRSNSTSRRKRRPQNEVCDESMDFDFKLVKWKRKKTDDVQYMSVNYNSTDVYITHSVTTALHLTKQYAAFSCKLGDLSFVCSTKEFHYARQLSTWLYSLIEKGDLPSR